MIDGVALDSSLDQIQIVAAVIQAITAVVITWATLRIIGYTKATIDEAKRDRRNDIIEKKLESVYSPLYQIFRESIFHSYPITLKNGVYTINAHNGFPDGFHPSSFDFTKEQFEQMGSILGQTHRGLNGFCYVCSS